MRGYQQGYRQYSNGRYGQNYPTNRAGSILGSTTDCVRVLDEARVGPDDVDRAMRFGANWPIGPCALIDLIGVDVHVHASEALHGALGEERMAPPERLLEMQREGLLGRKSGRGFYKY